LPVAAPAVVRSVNVSIRLTASRMESVFNRFFSKHIVPPGIKI
jgi:hypothetical protein